MVDISGSPLEMVGHNTAEIKSQNRTALCAVCRRDRIRSRYLNSLFPSDQLSFSSFLPPPTSPTINGDHEAPENVRLYCLTGSLAPGSMLMLYHLRTVVALALVSLRALPVLPGRQHPRPPRSRLSHPLLPS